MIIIKITGTVKIMEREVKHFGGGVFIDEALNRVSVSVVQLNQEKVFNYLEEKIPDFKRDSIVFTTPATATTTDAAGSTINTVNSGEFTLGYNVRINSNNQGAFVTCGHFDGSTVRRGSSTTSLGTVTGRRWRINTHSSDTIDAAYITYSTQSNLTHTNLPAGSITGTLANASITQGMGVTKYGRTTKQRNGTVTSRSATTPGINNTTFVLTDQVQMDIRQEVGDSGAPVMFYFVGPTQTPPYYRRDIIGIATIQTNNFNTAFASKAVNINSAFGLTTFIY
jgi:hypothetical protein